MSKPKSVIAWMAALSIGLNSSTDFSSVTSVTAVCIVIGFFTNAFYSVVFSIKGMMRRCQRFRRKMTVP